MVELGRIACALAAGLSVLLAGCALGVVPGKGGDRAADCAELPAADSARLDMIRKTLAAGKPHAALAYLDAAGFEAPAAQLLRADALRQTGRAEAAEHIYGELRGSCLAGFAHQGLGLVARQAGRGAESAAHLHRARLALPADPAIRNDYGEALLALGRTEDAVHEFLTAVELGPDDRRPALNLLRVLLQSGDESKALAFARQAGLSAHDVAVARRGAGQGDRPGADDSRPLLGPAPPPPAEPRPRSSSGEIR